MQKKKYDPSRWVYYDYFLVLDLEATCCDDESIPSHDVEMIEIGALMIEAVDLKTVSEFQTFVKPVKNPILTPFCTQLTSITQDQVDRAPEYPQAIVQFQAWLEQYPKYLFGSWGEFDRQQFKRDCRRHEVLSPFTAKHVNLKKAFAQVQGLPRRYGMPEALQMAKIPMDGTHHRGIDDARNIAKLLPYILGRQQIPEEDWLTESTIT